VGSRFWTGKAETALGKALPVEKVQELRRCRWLRWNAKGASSPHYPSTQSNVISYFLALLPHLFSLDSIYSGHHVVSAAWMQRWDGTTADFSLPRDPERSRDDGSFQIFGHDIARTLPQLYTIPMGMNGYQ
jgi:hypothetical protein